MKMLTIGVFDGVHKGHQSLLDCLNEQSILVTFSTHPAQVLTGKAPLLLSSPSLKRALLKTYGILEPIVIPFTPSLSEISFETFLERFSFQHLVLGEGAAFGKGGKGNATALRELGARRGFTVQTVPKLSIAGQVISSSRIRSLIEIGQLEEAEMLLNHPYCMEYSPFLPPSPIALPPDGVYSVWSYFPAGMETSQLTIRNRLLYPESRKWQLISFSQNLNPTIFKNLCQISPAVS